MRVEQSTECEYACKASLSPVSEGYENDSFYDTEGSEAL